MLTTRLTGVRTLAIVGTAAVLFACGGGGGGSDPASPLPSKFFVADSGSGNAVIGSVINLSPAPNGLVVDRLIQGPSTGLVPSIGSFALDVQNDRLYVGNNVAIRVFNGASFANGNVAPARTISKQSGLAMSVASLFLDTAADRLYVGDSSNGAVLVYNSASTINNVVDPDRTITGFDQVLGVQVDTAKDILYVTNRSATPAYTIRVFDGASTLNGAAAPNRTITPHTGASDMPVGDLFVDKANDRLYVAGGQNTLVMAFDTAHSADGPIAPTKTLSFAIVNGSTLKSVVVDTAHDRLYVVGPSVIFTLPNVSLASGSAQSTFALAPFGSIFSAIAVSP